MNYLNAKFKLAARRGNIKLLEELKEKGAEVNHSDNSTALINAVQSEDVDCFKFLVNSCAANVNLPNSNGETALHYACFLGQAEMVRVLVENKVDVHAMSNNNISAFNYSMFSTYPEIALKVLEEGGAVEKKSHVPLAFSLVNKHDKPKILGALLNKGGVESLHDEKGNTLAHLVVQFQRDKCTDLLLTAMPELFDAINAEGQLPLHMAALLGGAKIVEKILMARRVEIEHQLFTVDAQGRTAAHYAAASVKPEALSILLEAGADIEVEDSNGLSALTLACVTGTAENIRLLVSNLSEDHLEKHSTKALCAAVHGGHAKAVGALCRSKFVVEYGLRGFTVSPDESPFLLAGHYGNAEMIEVMIGKHEALLDQQDGNGKTILHICASRGNLQALKYLCSVLHEEYLNIFTKLGRNALWYAAAGGHVDCVKVLLEHGVDNEVGDNTDLSPLAAACKAGHVTMMNLLAKSGMDMNTKNTDGMTPLMQAAISGQTKLVKALIDLGADVNMPDKKSFMTPLHHAAQNGQAEMCCLLVKAGADLNAPDKRLRTPLHSAVYYGRTVVATALVRMGANTMAVDKTKLTCPAAAASVGNHDLAKTILQKEDRGHLPVN